MNTQRKTEPGSRHWRWQRLSAAVLIPFALWFTWQIAAHLHAPYETTVDWLRQPWTAPGLMIYLAVMLWHSQLGLQVVVEDYVACESRRRKIIIMLKIMHCAAAAVLLISLGCIVW